ncbi:pentapeptide repeat-containing protein [Actinoallomurus purpureus]|uniref:pentapeptide repeat-containing protein n=1 Tax=Actinoallomurus purpureus TaxID=478114 RepID=UPI002093A82B|nr:pentapeptide repeat-containing protein [Actinoallomurus purpureus]MCO6009301.1 pentapeptide repeat-containing protein [Actinoallomurus purpureus]
MDTHADGQAAGRSGSRLGEMDRRRWLCVRRGQLAPAVEGTVMETRTIRRTSVTLPALHEDDLSVVASLDPRQDRIADFTYADVQLRELALTGVHLLGGRITEAVAQRTRFEELRVDSVTFSGCDLSDLRWTDSKVSRVVFTGCKLMGAALTDLTLDNVLLENCRLDYATFTHVRATGPVILSKCSLRETEFASVDFSAVLFDGCDLTGAEFSGGQYRDLDLRGNDLSRLRGVGSLRQVIIDRPQTQQLAEALAADLDVTYGEDVDEF